jgi:hypothetical protein
MENQEITIFIKMELQYLSDNSLLIKKKTSPPNTSNSYSINSATLLAMVLALQYYSPTITTYVKRVNDSAADRCTG